MTRQAITLEGTQNFIDNGASEVLATLDGFDLNHVGPFIYATGNGSNTTPAQTVAVSKLIPPAYVGNGNASYAYGSGLVDSWSYGMSAMTILSKSSTNTATSSGTFREWGADLGTLNNSRPYMVALLGDGIGTDHWDMTILGTQKHGILASAEDYSNAVLRYADRVNVPLASGSGTITVSHWGNIATLNITGITNTLVGDPCTIATIPANYRPSVNTSVQIANHNAGRYFTCIVGTDGKINVYNNSGVTLSNAWGGALFKIGTAVSNPNRIHNKIPLTLNNSQKYVYQFDSSSSYNCKWTTATNINGTAGTLYLYRVDNFVFGSAVSYSVTETGQLSGWQPFQVPTGFRPARTEYSFGAGWQYSGNTSPILNARIAAQIGSNGIISIWSSIASAPNTNMGMSFYYECTE